MKKLFTAAAILAVLFLAAGSSMALPLGINQSTSNNSYWSGQHWDYVEQLNFYEMGQGGDHNGYWIGNTSRGFDQSSMSYAHHVPLDLNNGVQRAWLWINADYVDTRGNLVTLEGRFSGHLNQSNWSFDWSSFQWTNESNTIYDLTPLPRDIWSDPLLNMSIESTGWSERGIRVNSSTLALNYHTGHNNHDGGDCDPTHAAVPEPLTFTLFGLGLLGLGLFRRFK